MTKILGTFKSLKTMLSECKKVWERYNIIEFDNFTIGESSLFICGNTMELKEIEKGWFAITVEDMHGSRDLKFPESLFSKIKYLPDEKVEKERKEIRNKRSDELKPYIIFIRNYSELIEMPEEDYKKELSEVKKGAELQWEYERECKINANKLESERLAREEAEKRAETERAERAEKAKEGICHPSTSDGMTVWGEYGEGDPAYLEVKNTIHLIEIATKFNTTILVPVENVKLD